MERGYLADRFSWTSLGWNGLNGRARFAVREDGGRRFHENFGGLLKSWKRQEGYALLIGQVIGDAALAGTNISLWYAEAAKRLREEGYDVRFRRHPLDKRMTAVNGVPDAGGSLNDAFARASVVVTWNSNTAVESVLAGVPTVAMDQDGSMAAGVSSGTIDEITPDRYGWASDLAWKQFTMDEIATGFAWEIVRDALPLPA
jgi:hypothetical protein